MAVEYQLPIQPVVTDGLHRVLPPGSLILQDAGEESRAGPLSRSHPAALRRWPPATRRSRTRSAGARLDGRRADSTPKRAKSGLVNPHRASSITALSRKQSYLTQLNPSPAPSPRSSAHRRRPVRVVPDRAGVPASGSSASVQPRHNGTHCRQHAADETENTPPISALPTRDLLIDCLVAGHAIRVEKPKVGLRPSSASSPKDTPRSPQYPPRLSSPLRSRKTLPSPGTAEGARENPNGRIFPSSAISSFLLQTCSITVPHSSTLPTRTFSHRPSWSHARPITAPGETTVRTA